MLSSKTSVGTKLCANKVQGVSLAINVLNEDCTLHYREYRNVLGDTVVIFAADLTLYGKIRVKCAVNFPLGVCSYESCKVT